MDKDFLLEILACPKCHGNLSLLEDTRPLGFHCENCNLVYPVENEIPDMLIEDAVNYDTFITNHHITQ